jgi:mono/diheme cytochrome c family protein
MSLKLSNQNQRRTVAVIMLAVLGASGCEEAPDPTARSKMSGEALFDHYCAACHGNAGQGKLIKGVPPNRYTELSHSDVVNLILKGSQHPRHPMPAVASLSPSEAAKVATFVLDNLPRRAVK